jgi:hypothetical protein
VTDIDADPIDTDAAEDAGGEWLRRAPTGEPHQCRTPTTYSENRRMYLVDASAGDVWRCNCGRMWVCYVRVRNGDPGVTPALAWRRAGLWLRLRYSPAWGSLSPATWAGLLAGMAIVALIAGLSLLGVTPPP